MVFVVVELWKANAAFANLSRSDRIELFEGVRNSVKSLDGCTTLGWGRIDGSGDSRASGFDWFAIWEVASVEYFLDSVQGSGWYDYFDQVNVHGELKSVDEVSDLIVES
ncbi:hypothetical protein ABH922_000021 [Rhodococcus sp. 27YEA15]|uniref:DUF6616 family protein n=1 Tax=Rhodococcus sp. 27YEA15 TaxID=3156259 RepID=UPI003C7A539C